MIHPEAPRSYTIVEHTLFIAMENGVIIVDIAQPEIQRYIANSFYDADYPTPHQYLMKWRKEARERQVKKKAMVMLANECFGRFGKTLSKLEDKNIETT